MEALRARFRARAGEERVRLAEAVESDDREAARTIAHGLAGSGGIFGFPEVSAAAATLEEGIDFGSELGSLVGPLLVLLDAL